jgi:predicted RNA binding protein with dsRBD fold (UPF0201 family)
MRIEADLKATEDEEKLTAAIKNIFPNAKLKIEGKRIVGETDIEHFEKLIKEQKIRTTVYEILKQGHIDLHKLAAVAGFVAVDEGFPLGKIRLFLKS